MNYKRIDQIYDRYSVPDSLRQHLYDVAAIGDLICDSWTGPHLDAAQLRRVLLLHDIGNIVKMDVSDPALAEIKASVVHKYGRDDHHVSRAIASEVGLSAADLDLMDGKIFIRNDETAASSNYARKIGAYADQRVAPDGVRPLLDRLMEAKERYRDKPGTSMNNPRTDELIEKAVEIENQLTIFSPIVPNGITSDSVRKRADELRQYELAP